MANVKFNRGLEATLLEMATEPVNDITVTKVANNANYDSLYIGKQMIGTSLIRKMVPTDMWVPTMTLSGETWTTEWRRVTPDSLNGKLVITADYTNLGGGGNASAIMTARTLVDYEGVNADGYVATDGQILTARAIQDLITEGGGYYTDGSNNTRGGWNYQSTGWSTWTAVHSIDTHKSIAFTLPMANTGVSGYDASTDTEHLMTPAQIYALVTGNDTYHGTGAWGTSDAWNTYTAKYYKGGTEIASSGTGYQALSFTLPVETGIIVKHGETNPDYWDDHMPTSKAVAEFVEDYFSGVAGGMRYCGSISAASIPAGTKTGDVFIASVAFDILPSTQGVTWHVEQGDMVVIKGIGTPTSSTQTLNSEYCDVFERNLDGSVTAPSNLGLNNMVVGNATDTKTVKTVSFVTADINNTDIVIAHNVGGTVQNIAVAESLLALQWNELQ